MFTVFACSQEAKKIKIDELKSNKDFEVTFMKKDYLIDLDTVNVHIKVFKKIVIQKNKVNNFPKNIMFSNDTLFGQNNNYGIGYAIFTNHNNKRIRIKDFEFKKYEKYEFELAIQYRSLISLNHKKKIVLNSLVKKDSIRKDPEYQSYYLQNTKDGIELLNTIVPDSLKGYIVFNVVNNLGEHQFYQYKKIDF